MTNIDERNVYKNNVDLRAAEIPVPAVGDHDVLVAVHITKATAALDQLLEIPDDQRVAVEAVLQRAASAVVMQQLFSMTG